MMNKALFGLCAAGLTGVAAAEAIDNDREVAALVERAGQAHERLMRGDIAGYRRAIELAPDFTIMDPFGGKPGGPPKDEAQWQRFGAFFRDGRDAAFQPIASYRSDGLIVLVANERAHVAVGRIPAQDWALRVTLVFRNDGGAWRLVHRHADPLVPGLTQEQAARLAGARRQADGP